MDYVIDVDLLDAVLDDDLKVLAVAANFEEALIVVAQNNCRRYLEAH